MSEQVPAQRIRFALNISLAATGIGTPIDVVSGTTMQIANGADLQLEIGFWDGIQADANLVDFSDIGSVVIALMQKTNPHSGGILWSFSVPNNQITNTMTTAQWQAAQPNSLANIVLAVPNSDNGYSISNNPTATYWLCIYGVTTDATPKNVPYGFFQVNVLDTGIPVPNPSLPQGFKVGTKLSFLCSDAQTRDLTLSKPGSLWTAHVDQIGYNGPSQAIYSLYCVDGFWRDLSVVHQGGIWVLNINQTGHS